jgi:hypothetical protein
MEYYNQPPLWMVLLWRLLCRKTPKESEQSSHAMIAGQKSERPNKSARTDDALSNNL